MQPTPRANTLIAAARAVLARVGTDIVAQPLFDPNKSGRTVTLAMSDVGEVGGLNGASKMAEPSARWAPCTMISEIAKTDLAP